MTTKLCITLLVIAIVNGVRSDTVQLPVYGSGASYYEHYAHNANPGDPKFCNPYQTNYNLSQCFNLAEYLTVQVGIGNPVQNLNLTLDDFSDDVFVFSDGAADTNCLGFGDNGRPDTCRDSGPGDAPKGVVLMGSDDFKVAGKLAQKVPFMVVKTLQSTVQSFWPSDGVFSLSKPVDGKSKSAVYRIASSIGSPQTTLFIKRTSGYSRGDRVGTLTVGGRDAKNCDKTWSDLPLGSRGWGAFNTKLNTVSLGSAEIYKNLSAAGFVVRSPTIGVPVTIFPLIGEMLSATYEPKTQFYVIPCDRVKDAPPLTFQMEGLEYTIPAVDYIRNLVPRSDNMCTVLMEVYGVSEKPNGQWVMDWVLGLPAMRSFCWNFDYDTNSVSVAKAIQDV
ncbi:Protein ASP-8 [Aphelenchoides avenae]|nr:Protein ASP-8 [Aphelenchus avenae]